MKKILNLLVILMLFIGVVGCSGDSQESKTKPETTQKEDNKQSNSEEKEIILSDYPEADKAQKAIMDEFKNKLVDSISLTQSKSVLVESEYINVEYANSELVITVVVTKDGSFKSYQVESLIGDQGDAYIRAITASLLLNVFGFSVEDQTNITIAVANGETGGRYNGFEVSNFSVGTTNMIIIYG